MKNNGPTFICDETREYNYNYNDNYNENDSIFNYSFMKEKRNIGTEQQNNRKLFKSKSTNNVNHASVNQKSIYHRQMEKKILHNQKIDEKRNRKRLDELDTLKPFPMMSENSKQILKQRNSRSVNKPLHLRINEEKEKKKILIENIRNNLINHDPYYSEAQKEKCKDTKKSFNPEMFNDWLGMNEAWKQKKEAKLDYMRKDIHEKEENEENLVFAPKIDKTSDMLAKLKNLNDHPGMSLVERLYSTYEENLKKIESKKLMLTPSFIPSINKSYNSNVSAGMLSKSKTFVYELEDSASASVIQSKPNLSRQNSHNVESTNNLVKQLTPQRKKSNNNMQPKEQDKDKETEKEKEKEKVYIDDGNLYKLNVRNNLSWKLPESSIKLDENKTENLLRNIPNYWK